jgi:hypothetical protein
MAAAAAAAAAAASAEGGLERESDSGEKKLYLLLLDLPPSLPACLRAVSGAGIVRQEYICSLEFLLWDDGRVDALLLASKRGRVAGFSSPSGLPSKRGERRTVVNQQQAVKHCTPAAALLFSVLACLLACLP